MFLKNKYVMLLQVLIPAVLALLVYSNTFHVPFQYDDHTHIFENPIIRDFSYFLHPDSARNFMQYETFRSRYVGYLSFAFDFWLHELDVTGYHAVNLLIHIMNTLLVFAFVVLVFRTPVLRRSAIREQARWIAFLSALLFTIHPVQTQAVTYIVQRFVSLGALFYFGTMVCYLCARLAVTKMGRYLLHFTALVLCILAMYTKQTAFTLPLTVTLVEFMFFRGPMRGRALLLMPLLLTMAIVIFNAVNFDTGVAGAANMLDIPRSQYLMTEARVLVTYLRLIVLPAGQNLEYDYPLSDTLFSAPVIVSLLLLLSFFGLGVFMYRLSRRGESAWRLASFGIFMFFLSISVESTFIPLRPIFEHRMYLPFSGIVILLGAIGVIYFQRSSRTLRKALLFLVVSACAALSLLAYERNGVWSSEESLWSDVVQKAPGNARAHLNLGSAFYKAGSKRKAMDEYKRSLALFAPFQAQYKAMTMQEHLRELNASGIYSRTAEDYAKLLYNMGIVSASTGHYDDAVDHFRKALQVMPNYVDALFNLGLHYYNMGRTSEARAALTEALRYDPGNKVIRRLLALIDSETNKSSIDNSP